MLWHLGVLIAGAVVLAKGCDQKNAGQIGVGTFLILTAFCLIGWAMFSH